MFTLVLYALAVILLALSLAKDRAKTRLALKKAWKAFENILPQLLTVILIIGLALAVLTPQAISRILGRQSGLLGMAAASVLGSITLIPAFVAFPLAAALLQGGAGMAQVTVFVSTLMMVGVVTAPMEIRYFGRKAALLRNGLAFVFSWAAALIIGGVLG